jgi:TolB-like protein
MKKRPLGTASLLALAFVSVFLLWSHPAYCTNDFLMNDSGFMDKQVGEWGFIPDYTGMIKGDTVDWVWTKPGVSLTQYKTVEVPAFQNLWKESDVTAQDLLTRDMKDGLSRRLGLTVVDKDADITVKGAVVDYFTSTSESGTWAGRGTGESLVEVEVYVVDNKTKEIISKVRHQAADPTIDGAIAETISDIISEWTKE